MQWPIPPDLIRPSATPTEGAALAHHQHPSPSHGASGYLTITQSESTLSCTVAVRTILSLIYIMAFSDCVFLFFVSILRTQISSASLCGTKKKSSHTDHTPFLALFASYICAPGLGTRTCGHGTYYVMACKASQTPKRRDWDWEGIVEYSRRGDTEKGGRAWPASIWDKKEHQECKVALAIWKKNTTMEGPTKGTLEEAAEEHASGSGLGLVRRDRLDSRRKQESFLYKAFTSQGIMAVSGLGPLGRPRIALAVLGDMGSGTDRHLRERIESLPIVQSPSACVRIVIAGTIRSKKFFPNMLRTRLGVK